MKSILTALLIGISAVICAGESFPNTSEVDMGEVKARDNLQQTPIGSSGRWSLEKLLALTQEEGVELWRSLPAVAMKEMNGHYLGLIPGVNRDVGAEERSVYGGFWLGKAFKPISETSGEGYNRFRSRDGRIIRTSRMVTYIGPSLVDGKPAYIVDYAKVDKSISVIDELRKLDDFIYLGIATSDAGNGRRTAPSFWVLTGPTDEWVGPDSN